MGTAGASSTQGPGPALGGKTAAPVQAVRPHPFADGDGPRDRLLSKGAQALSDQELVAVLLCSGQRGNPVQALAAGLLQAGGGLKALAQRDPQELVQLPGLGPARAAQMLAALELGRRVQRAGESRPRLCTPQAIFGYIWPELCALQKEVFHVLCLNGRNVLIADVRVAQGSTDACPVDPREVFRAALTARASGVVLVHNHPSGEVRPSPQDLHLTRHLARAGAVLRVKLLDHLVVGDGRFHSMLEQGQLQRICDQVEGEGWAASGGG
jgi:DNA repair protein RadC